MTGPEHYREAEQILTEIKGLFEFDIQKATKSDVAALHQSLRSTLALAQVHATLALAAATAYPAHQDNGTQYEVAVNWAEVTGS